MIFRGNLRKESSSSHAQPSTNSHLKQLVSEKNIPLYDWDMKELAGEGCWNTLFCCVMLVPPYIRALYSEVRLAMLLTSWVRQ